MSESNTKRYSLDQLRAMKSQTDWDRLAKQGDHEGEPEINVDWANAKIVVPEPKKMISLRVDPDVLSFFKGQGKGYQTRMNAVLRAYVEAQRS